MSTRIERAGNPCDARDVEDSLIDRHPVQFSDDLGENIRQLRLHALEQGDALLILLSTAFATKRNGPFEYVIDMNTSSGSHHKIGAGKGSNRYGLFNQYDGLIGQHVAFKLIGAVAIQVKEKGVELTNAFRLAPLPIKAIMRNVIVRAGVEDQALQIIPLESGILPRPARIRGYDIVTPAVIMKQDLEKGLLLRFHRGIRVWLRHRQSKRSILGTIAPIGGWFSLSISEKKAPRRYTKRKSGNRKARTCVC